ncbi:tetratricopeptide repeat protein [Sphingobacterium sp. SGL-16]|uniref:tetratricopeptide repeat protein n=1 Tax=Sphingobacterium sp. SGL-16 TaxID=2710883 RepID=UPI0013EE0F6B|nr:tetratricopeptide repeat protein [Sphingobacterium sp. SGL-16]NGM73090.1 tetratricopeptide repeat protein [Sphingobacterium sp. SGL-16]
MRFFTIAFFTIISTVFLAYGQTSQQDTLDPYGFVTKYDTGFNGIGPKVYILPLPRTLKDEMIDTYKEIQSFQDSIRLGFQYQRLLSTFKHTTNHQIIGKVLPDTISTQEYSRLLQQFVDQKNHAVLYAFYNSKAENDLHDHNTEEAVNALYTALSHAQAARNELDIAIIQSNLASIFLITNRLQEALTLETLYLDHTNKTKNLAEQAASNTRIALIQAYGKDYKAAENTVIRKAIPLFNKSKFYEGKIEAWIILAEIYRSQNKHTEAQWFLIQARDLAKEKSYSEKLAMIEYMLGSSKMIQANYKVAKNELEFAWKLAEESSNKFLQLAIAEQLGRSYVYLKDYELAKSFLEQYWILRNNLFSKNITSIL